MNSNFFCHLLCHSMPAYYSTPKRIRWKSKPHEIVCLLAHVLRSFTNYVCKRRGVDGQKNQTLVNVVCEWPLKVLAQFSSTLFPQWDHCHSKVVFEFSLKTVKLILYDLHHHQLNGALPQNQGETVVKINYFNMASSERHWTHCVLVGTGFPWWCSVCFGEINSPLILVILPCNLLPSSIMYSVYCIELEGSLGFKLPRQQIKQEDRNGPRHSIFWSRSFVW